MHDGDTVHLKDGRKVRLIGINTPELAHNDKPAQAYANQARIALESVISAHSNHVGLVYGAERHDRYKRTLAHIFTPAGDNLQAQLLAQGLAAAIAHPPNTVFTECYTWQEQAARCNNNGIWSQPGELLLDAARLEQGSEGFHLVNGRVDKVSKSRGGVWIFMAALKLRIGSENLPAFDTEQLLALQGQRLTARGWLQPARSRKKTESANGNTFKYFMRIRHPSALEINPAPAGAKC